MISSYRRLVLLHHYNKFEFVYQSYGKSDNLDLTMCEMMLEAMKSNDCALKFIKAIKKLRKDEKAWIDGWRHEISIINNKWQLFFISEPNKESLIWVNTGSEIFLCKFYRIDHIYLMNKAGRSFENLTASGPRIHPNINLKWQYFC